MPSLQFPFRPGAIFYFLPSSCISVLQAVSDDGAVDTDKKPRGVELSDCIDFMRKWEEGAQACYAFLENDGQRHAARDLGLEGFVSAQWFTNGWSLREMVGLRTVHFFSADWSDLGTTWSLSDVSFKATLDPPSNVPELSGQRTKLTLSSAFQRIFEDSETTAERRGGAQSLAGLYRRKGADVLAWNFCVTPAGRSLCVAIPVPDCRRLWKFVGNPLHQVEVAPKSGRKRRHSMRELSSIRKFNPVYFKPQNPHSELRIYIRDREKNYILPGRCLPDQGLAYCRSGRYDLIIPASMVFRGSCIFRSEAAGMLFLPYGAAGKPLERFLVLVGSEQKDADSEPIVWCIVHAQADEQLLKSEYEQLKYSFHEVLERHRKEPSESGRPRFGRLDGKSMRLSDGRSMVYVLARQRAGKLSLHLAMRFETAETEVKK